MARQRRQGALELGVILLFYEIMGVGVQNVPPATLIAIVGQALLYIGFIDVPWAKHDVCISAFTVLKKKDWKRLFLSAFEHGDDMHLYYNMASFMIKGRTLERRYGTKKFALLLIFLTLLTNIIYVAIGQSLTELTHELKFQNSCAIGFSGVIFALKVLTTYENPGERVVVANITMPGKYAAWFELILIHMLVPNASFIGHLAGILAGIIYFKTIIGTCVDNFISSVTGEAMSHFGSHEYQRNDYRNDDNNHYTYGQYNSGSSSGTGFNSGPRYNRRTDYGWNYRDFSPRSNY